MQTADAAPSGESAHPQAKNLGRTISDGPIVPIASILKAPDEHAGKSVRVEGMVRAACKRRGCWMELAPTLEHGGPGCRVTFEGYGFFVPTDSEGSRAIVEGSVKVRTVPPAEVAHMEEEGGTFPAKQSDGSAREVRITATGVRLTRAER